MLIDTVKHFIHNIEFKIVLFSLIMLFFSFSLGIVISTGVNIRSERYEH